MGSTRNEGTEPVAGIPAHGLLSAAYLGSLLPWGLEAVHDARSTRLRT